MPFQFDPSALFNYPGLKSRSDQAHSTAALDALHNIDDPFRTMKADQIEQSGLSEWAPFYQALSESGVDKIRMPGSPLDGLKKAGKGRQPDPQNNPLDAMMLARYPGADGSGQ